MGITEDELGEVCERPQRKQEINGTLRLVRRGALLSDKVRDVEMCRALKASTRNLSILTHILC